MHKKNLRPAIGMIELIFAIVIIGITMMSAPMLISQASKSGYIAIQQEGINEASSHISMIMGYDWDESNTESDAYDTILETDSTVADINESSSLIFPGYRIGTPKESLRNYKVERTLPRLAASSIGTDLGDTAEDDIDDFDGTIVHLDDLSSGSATADNIEKTTDINMSTSVIYISDAPTSGAYNTNPLTFNFSSAAGVAPNTSNIKRISVTLTSESGIDELNKTIVLHAFSCNIGGTGELGWR